MRSGFTSRETGPDGGRLRIGFWPAEGGRGQVVLLPGRSEFLEKYEETIGELRGRGFDVWAMDWRGQGLSDRALADRRKGYIDDFDTYLRDLVWFVETFASPRRAATTCVLAHSMGGHIALRAVLEAKIAPDRMVLLAPMIDLPWNMRPYARWLTGVATGFGLGAWYIPGTGPYDPERAAFEGNALTGDRARFDRTRAAIAANPAVALGGPTFGWLDAALRSVDRLRAAAAAGPETCPILVCIATDERVVSIAAQKSVCGMLPRCGCVEIPDSRHEILMERDERRALFWREFDTFLS